MEKRVNSLNGEIESISKKFIEKISEKKNKEIQIIGHFDTDGISSTTIMMQTLKRLDKRFSVKIIKGLEESFILSLSKNKINLFLDLASGSLNCIAKSGLNDVFIIDHHEIIQKIPENVHIINPELHNQEKISSSGLTYLFCKQIDQKNKDLAKLAVLGMVGDMLEKEIDRLNDGILKDSEIRKKKGLLIYPSTRPLNRVLEFSSSPYIPGVTGNSEGVIELLREVNMIPTNGKYKNIADLTKEEMERLVTAILLRIPKSKNYEIIGDIFSIKLFNKLEDVREISAIINACSKMGDEKTAIEFLMELPRARKKASSAHVKYRQHILTGLKFVSETEKISGEGFVIINAKNKIKDTIIGTIASILSTSSLYEEGTTIITMAIDEQKGKIKASARNCGRTGRNVRETLNNVVEKIGGEVGGHEFAAGCIISLDKEQEFINSLKRNFEVEVVRV